MARQNLMTNPSFRADASGWVAVNGATILHKDDGGYYGDSYLSVEKSSIGSSGVKNLTPIEVPSGSTGLPYAASAYVRVPIIEAEDANLVIRLIWTNFEGVQVGEDSSELLTVEANGEWTRESVIGSVPVGATGVSVSLIQLIGGTAGKRFDVDAVLLEQSSYVGGYLDNISQAEEKKLVDQALQTKYQAAVFEGMELNADVTIGDLVLNSIDENGVVWVCTDIEGWWGHSEPEIPDIQRGVEDGSYDVTGRYKARVLTLKGIILVQDTTQLARARDTLISATNLVRQGAWLRTNEEPTRAAFVRLSGRPQIQTVNARGRTEFSIGLKAADPIKYKWNDASLDGTESIDIPRVEIPTAGTDVFTIIRRSATENECTLTTSTSHGYAVGQTIVVSNVSSRYNGTFKVSSVTSNTLTYTLVGLVEAETSSTGTVVNKTQVTVVNDGTADVTATFIVTGPIGAGSTITNTTTGEVLTIVQQLRGSGPIARVSKSELKNNVAIITTIEPHRLIIGDKVEVYGIGAPYDTVETTVKSITTSTPYTFSFDLVNPDIAESAEDGGVSLKNNDVLTINTYDRSVTYNGDIIGHRSKVDTLVDWIKLTPGSNTITFDDSIDPFTIVYKDFDDATGFATLTTSEAHFLVPGQDITVAMKEEATLFRKVLEDNVITMTTTEPHGFSVGDSIDVISTEISSINNKQLSANVATLTTVEDNGINIGDTVVVDLNVDNNIVSKSSTANVVTLQMSAPHGASIGDQMTVLLPTTASISNKSLTTNVATITTSAAHNYSVGDIVTIALPTSAVVNNKYISGSTVVLSTNADHGFSVGDKINITLPTTATPTAISYLGGSINRVTITTQEAHGFIVGDIISVNTGVSPTATVTNKSATSGSPGTCTLTTSSTHNFSVGERITVSGVGARYDGTHTITAVNPGSRTVSYLFGTASDSSASSSGTITNNTIQTGYNGTKVIESVTTTSPYTLTYYYYGQDGNVSNSIIGNAPILTNVTNSSIDGIVTINSTPSSTQFSYTKVS